MTQTHPFSEEPVEIQKPKDAIEIAEGAPIPEGYKSYSEIMQNAYSGMLNEQRAAAAAAGKNPLMKILGVPTDEAKMIAAELVQMAPEQTARFMAGIAWLVLNQSDVVDRVGTAVQDSIVFMNNHAGQLNTRNYAVTREVTKTTNLRLDYLGRSGDLTDPGAVAGHKFVIVGPKDESEFHAGVSAWSAVHPINRTSIYHIIHQLTGLELPNEPATLYISFSISDQDPFNAPVRAINDANPAPDKTTEGTLKVNPNL